MSLPHDKPLTDEDCDFLQNIFCQALPGRKHIVDLSALKSADKIQGYAIVLKLIDGKKLNVLILSATKFSIVIGSLCAYLSRNRFATTSVSNDRNPISTFCNQIAVVKYLRNSHDANTSYLVLSVTHRKVP